MVFERRTVWTQCATKESSSTESEAKSGTSGAEASTSFPGSPVHHSTSAHPPRNSTTPPSASPRRTRKPTESGSAASSRDTRCHGHPQPTSRQVRGPTSKPCSVHALRRASISRAARSRSTRTSFSTAQLSRRVLMLPRLIHPRLAGYIRECWRGLVRPHLREPDALRPSPGDEGRRPGQLLGPSSPRQVHQRPAMI